MSRKKKGHHEDHVDESWLLPYSDMMTLLLALFIVMFASSSADEAKFNAMAASFFTAFGGTSETGIPFENIDFGALIGEEGGENANFSDLFTALIQAVKNSGYEDSIDVIKGDNFITVRFSESVLFLPNRSTMTPEGREALQTIGDILLNLQQLIGHIQIEGHTAFIGEEADRTMTAWELSSDRAIVVLEYLTTQVGYKQEKLNTAGFSHFVPVAPNDTEEGRAKNRRVELRITQEAPSASRAKPASQAEGSSDEEGAGSQAESAASESESSAESSQSSH